MQNRALRVSLFFRFISLSIAFFSPLLPGAAAEQPSGSGSTVAPFEVTLHSSRDYANPYMDVNVSVTFWGGGLTIRRPAFWDGGRTWKVRVAAPARAAQWNWKAECSDARNDGLQGATGSLALRPYRGPNGLLQHGLLGISAGHRNVVQADGTPLLLVGDTAWSLPWRGTPESVSVYAADRQRKGFNAALLMSVQPDQGARGPEDRQSPGSFAVAFRDLPAGHITQMNVAYFHYLDGLVSILLEHGIVPVYQPVFQGYGWKGLQALGASVDAQEYARYCRYLVARFGAAPALWLVSADNTGLQPAIEAGGQEIRAWDAYRQPIGIHYSPFDGDPSAPVSKTAAPHHNRSHQEAEWLDFQWCQTGHKGVHNTSKVAQMHENQPTKAVANGEPTYEGIGGLRASLDWWQGNEAWSNLTAGGTMGVFYGVAALWQWKLTPDEPGWPAWARDGLSWEQALRQPGSRYLGYVGKAFAAYDFADMTKHPELAEGQLCVARPGQFYVVYLPAGGAVRISGLRESLPYRWFNPKSGEWARGGGQTRGVAMSAIAPGGPGEPWVLFVGRRR